MMEDNVKKILADYRAGVPVREIAARHGVSQSQPGLLARRHGVERDRPPKPAQVTNGQELRQWRLHHGLTQAELALKLGVAEITIRSCENGKRCVKNLATLL